jgi:hypothetical protein
MALGMPAGLLFQTIIIVDDGANDVTPAPWSQPPGLRVRLSEPSPIALPKHDISLRVNQELEILAGHINQVMQLVGGVLLTVSLQERAATTPEDQPTFKFNWVSVDRPGPVPSLVLRTQMASHPRRGRADKGYTHTRIYLWATKAAA